jgi:hypothetical protein
VFFAASVVPEMRITRDAYDESRFLQESGESIGHSTVSAFAVWYALPTPGLPEDAPKATIQSVGSIVVDVALIAESFDTSQVTQIEHQIESGGYTTAEITFTENALTTE